MLYQLLYP